MNQIPPPNQDVEDLLPEGRRFRPLRILLAEDDFSTRVLLQTFLSRYGECHIAVNGGEAVTAFDTALRAGSWYDLICMDILMPEMTGREAVTRIRASEESQGILSTTGAKIVMITQINDVKEVSRCYEQLCDSYLIKPIDLNVLRRQMRDWSLIE